MSVGSYFNKKFKFSNDGYTLPGAEVFFSTPDVQKHKGLQIIKSILNHVKSKLNDYQIEEWSRHTRQRNPAQQVLTHLKNVIHAEFVTQAFAKFYECVNAYPLFNNVNNETVFQSVHLCEAPGAFVSSLNHYMKSHHSNIEFRWRASTLNPYFEGNSITNVILDDRLIFHTLEKWIFGEDYDGDILNEGNIRSLNAYCKSFGPVNLVTGDGSIDCQDQPENQEEFVSKLHSAEVIVGLSILADGGSLLVKMFTFFESSSIAMLYILNCCFDELHVFKPATSKEGNSEVYVIGIGFKKNKLSKEIIEQMITNFKDDTKAVLPLDVIPSSFQDQIVEAARIFMNLQVSVIEGNIRTFKKYDKHERERIKVMKDHMVEEFVRLYKVFPIREDQKILQGLQISNERNLNIRVHSGSHSERISFLHLSRADRLQVFFDRLKQFHDSILESALNSCCVVQKITNHEMTPESFINLIHGRSVIKVVSSKFILVSLIRYLIEIRTFLEEAEQFQDEYDGTKFEIKENKIIIELEFFRRASTYDTYEKEVTLRILDFLLKNDLDSYIVDGLPLFTQFLVGVILYLAMFVFEEVHLKRSSGTISFKFITKNGKDCLRYLKKVISEDQSSSKALLGICDTKLLFSQEFYKSVIDYNNHLCLKFCSFYLNISNNLQ